MLDVNIVKENYSRLSTVELINLSTKPQELRPEIHIILREELLLRNEIGAVESLDALLLDGMTKKSIRAENQETIFSEIKERIANGETIESIRIDLVERGISITELHDPNSLYKEENFEKRLAESIVERRLGDEGYKAIKEDIIENENLSEAEADRIISQAKEKGKAKKERGTIIIVICCLITIFTFVHTLDSGEGKFWVPTGPLLLGLYWLSKGRKQSSDE